MRIVVLTQPLPRVAALERELVRAGHDAIACPFSRLEPDPVEALRLSATRWEDYDRVLIVSPSAVQFLLDALGGRLPPGIRMGVVGPGSLQALQAAAAGDAPIDVIHPAQPPYDADSLLAHPALASVHGKRFLLLRGEKGRTDWIQVLARRGARIEERILYGSRPIDPPVLAAERLLACARRRTPAVFVATSRDAARGLARWAEAGGFGDWARSATVLTVHPRIATELSALGWRSIRCIDPGEQSLRAALESG